MKGGKLIGSGSYGCVFNPPLKCKKNTKKNKSINKVNTRKLISKLSLKYEALDEYEYNNVILNKLKKDKLFNKKKKHFLFIKDWCLPEKLKLKDELALVNQCDNMVGKSYKENKLKDLALLTMKYGGIDLDKYMIINILNDKKKFINRLVKLEIDLINNGIDLLHSKNIYHTDIKSLNILVDKSESYLYLIDWGLTTLDLPSVNDSIYKGIHFNRPYESLLFNINDNEFIKNPGVVIDTILNSYRDKIDNSSIKKDVQILFNNKLNKEGSISIIREYLLLILNDVLDGNRFNRKKLIEHYYVKQDYWGLITTLMDIYKYFELRDSEYEKNFRDIFDYITMNLRINKNVLIGLFKKLKRE
jgi:hypothetical protein